MADQKVASGGAPVTMGPAGYWLDDLGGIAATDDQGNPQQTPGMRDNPQSQQYYDAAKDLNYNLVNGQKVYQSPVEFVDGQTVYKKSLHGPATPDTGGGALHGGPQWNPQTGSWDVSLDWGKVLSWAAAAGITAGAITAAMPAGEAVPAALSSAPADATVTPEMAATVTDLGAVAPGALPAAAIPSAASTLPAAGGAADSGLLAATPTTIPSEGTGAVAYDATTGLPAGTGGGLGAVGSLAKSIPGILGAAGQGVGAAGSAALNKGLTLNDQNLAANNSNIQGQSAYETELLNRAKLEDTQRQQDLKNLYQQSYFAGGQGAMGPYDVTGPKPVSAAYTQGLADVGAAAGKQLAAPPQYHTNSFAPLPSYVPYQPNQNPGGSLANISNYLPPALNIASKIPPGAYQAVGDYLAGAF